MNVYRFFRKKKKQLSVVLKPKYVLLHNSKKVLSYQLYKEIVVMQFSARYKVPIQTLRLWTRKQGNPTPSLRTIVLPISLRGGIVELEYLTLSYTPTYFFK